MLSIFHKNSLFSFGYQSLFGKGHRLLSLPPRSAVENAAGLKRWQKWSLRFYQHSNNAFIIETCTYMCHCEITHLPLAIRVRLQC